MNGDGGTTFIEGWCGDRILTTLDEWLLDEGILSECTQSAIYRIEGWGGLKSSEGYVD